MFIDPGRCALSGASSAGAGRVAVITPVWNGADVIGGCVDSVRGQTIGDWVHVVVDNASDDGTAEVVGRAAGGDPRVRVVRHAEHLPMLGSWNRAMRAVPGGATWVKHLAADDRMAPHALAAMLDAAARSQRTVMVGARWREGDVVAPSPRHAVPAVRTGRQAMRDYLLGGPDVFGTPSASLFRRDALPAGDMYDASPWPPGLASGVPGPNTDKTALAPVLVQGDFVFVDDVLTWDEPRPGSQSGFAATMRIQVPGDIDMLTALGPRFLTRDELGDRLTQLSVRYARSLAKACAARRPLREPAFAVLHDHVLRHLVGTMRGQGFRRAPAVLLPCRGVMALAARRA